MKFRWTWSDECNLLLLLTEENPASILSDGPSQLEGGGVGLQIELLPSDWWHSSASITQVRSPFSPRLCDFRCFSCVFVSIPLLWRCSKSTRWSFGPGPLRASPGDLLLLWRRSNILQKPCRGPVAQSERSSHQNSSILHQNVSFIHECIYLSFAVLCVRGHTPTFRAGSGHHSFPVKFNAILTKFCSVNKMKNSNRLNLRKQFSRQTN